MPPFFSNLPALRLAVSYLLHDPSSLLPHHTVPTLISLPLPLSNHLGTINQRPRIRALVLDKDNTLSPPNTAKLHPVYIAKLKKIASSEEFRHNENSILIVSNTAGSTDSEVHESEAKELEQRLGVPVLRQAANRKKPLCAAEVLAFFTEKGVTTNPSEVVVVGDRIATDVLLAREMGSWSVWVRDGWRNPEMPGRDYRGFSAKMEARFERIMRGGFERSAPVPKALADTGEKERVG